MPHAGELPRVHQPRRRTGGCGRFSHGHGGGAAARYARTQTTSFTDERIKLQCAEDDPRVNATMEDYRTSLEANGKDYVIYTYAGTRHGFHNDSTPRCDKEQAQIAWDRTASFFNEHLR